MVAGGIITPGYKKCRLCEEKENKEIRTYIRGHKTRSRHSPAPVTAVSLLPVAHSPNLSTGPDDDNGDDADFSSILCLYAAVPSKHALFANARSKQVQNSAGEWRAVLFLYMKTSLFNISLLFGDQNLNNRHKHLG